MTGVLDLVPGVIPWPGSALITPPGPLNTSAAPSVLVLRLMPTYVPNTVRLTGLVVETTVAGEAGSLIRVGIYRLGNNGCPTGPALNSPDPLNPNGVTVAADAVAGFQEAACNVVLSPGWYAAGGQVELAPTTQPTIRTITAPVQSYPAASLTTNAAGWSYSGQTLGQLAVLTGVIPSASSLAYRTIYRTGVL